MDSSLDFLLNNSEPSNEENLLKMKHVELKEMCASLNLPAYGTKKEMVDRILEYYADDWGEVLEAKSTVTFVRKGGDSVKGDRV